MKVFVGSTYQDLLAYRAAATRAILIAGDLSEDMLYWPAADAPPPDESLRHLRSSDLMILLIAHRYGTPPSGCECSITELEFDEATRISLPVLAFKVDPNYAWPPPLIERDQEVRARLERFIEKVQEKVTVSSFTTPDSLEVAISHALARYSGRQMSVAIPEYAVKRLHHINRAESLFYTPDSTVRIGSAPDGAPLLLAVTRHIRITEAMAGIAEAVGGRADDQLFGEIISKLNHVARGHAAASGVYSSNWKDSTVSIYAPHRTLVDLMSPTLFQSMLGVRRKASGAGESIHSEGTRLVGLDASDLKHEEVASLGGRNRYLSVELDSDQRVWTGGWSSSRPAKFILSRPFIEEGLERLPGVRYVIKRKSDQYSYVAARKHKFATILDTETPHQFHDRWIDLLASTGDEELDRYIYEILIPRMSIVQFVLDLVEEVGNLHRDERIHGDIKPSNALVNRNGKTLIDEVGLTVGDISPTVTAGWSPCEQLLRQSLSCAADVFPLGQILLHVLGAQPLGREVQYRLPDGKKSAVIEDPAIYMEADGSIGSSAIRKSWCRFIERALKADPSQRWPNAVVMAGEMRTLIDRNGIEGYASISLPWGDRPSLVHKGGGEIGMGWAMHSDQTTRL